MGDPCRHPHAEVSRDAAEELTSRDDMSLVGEGFRNHRFGLADARGEALPIAKRAPKAGVLLDRPTHRGWPGGDHLHPGEGNGVIESDAERWPVQRSTPNRLFSRQHATVISSPDFVNPGEANGSRRGDRPLGWIARERKMFCPLPCHAKGGSTEAHLIQAGLAPLAWSEPWSSVLGWCCRG